MPLLDSNGLIENRGIPYMKPIFALLAACSVFAAATTADAATKVFTYSDNGTSVATGSFSYADGDTGVLGYNDLTAFSVSVVGHTYTLADIATLTDYLHFGYDTASNSFVASDTCGFAGCGYSSTLSAIDSTGRNGFFFESVPGEYAEYTTGFVGSFDKITIGNASAAPEPAAWGLMILGFGAVGAVLRGRRNLAVSYA
jgi:hypothetical protein